MLFKILHGDESNISLDVTPFHEGWAYVTHSGYFYVDLNVGTIESPKNQRLKLNANQAESLIGYNIATILNSSEVEIPTSKAVMDAIDNAISGSTSEGSGVYVQDTEPTDAEEGAVWVDTSNDPEYTIPHVPTVTEADNGKVLMVVNGKWQAVNLNLSIDANGVVSM